MKSSKNYSKFQLRRIFPAFILLLMRIVIEGVKILADNSMILGPSPSTPVAFEESSLLMYDSTWSHVISGILRKIFSKRLHVMVKCCNRWRSESGDSS